MTLVIKNSKRKLQVY